MSPRRMLRHRRVDSRRDALCAAVAVMCAACEPAAAAVTYWTVNSCDDANSGAGTVGTLRYAAAHAAPGDVINMSSLACGEISLTTGAIKVTQGDLRILGPGQAKLVIFGKYEKDRIFNHTGAGVLDLEYFSMSGGYVATTTATARGGCVSSAGTVTLNGVTAAYCTAKSDSGYVYGGAVYAAKGLNIKGGSLLRQNTVSGSTDVAGGGAFTPGPLLLEYSTIADNSAIGGSFGGIGAFGSASIKGSTISGNHADRYMGGIGVGDDFVSSVTMINSTVSGNSSAYVVGGMRAMAATIDIRNSTIVHNSAPPCNVFNFAAGLDLIPVGYSTMTLESSLLANNACGGAQNDLSVSASGSSIGPIGGSNNFVRTPSAAVPPDTIEGACPLLGTLRHNGGRTKTHALLSKSPAIDLGVDSGKNNDQRKSDVVNGSFVLYARVSGPFADIGAYEVQQDDIVFNTGFDGCP